MIYEDPVWCGFCEDRPAVGRMVIMRDRSRDMISEVSGDDGVACDLHGRAWTGVPVASHDETGEYAVLQYVHPDWEKITEKHIVAFAEEKLCTVCGDPTDPMPLWAVARILMAHPYLVLEHGFQWEGVCRACAHNSQCPHCNEKGGPPDEDDEGEEWKNSTHPYCH